VVWADDRAGNFDIYGYDLLTNTEDVMVDGPGDQTLASVTRQPWRRMANDRRQGELSMAPLLGGG
jgi:hypothetical protein